MATETETAFIKIPTPPLAGRVYGQYKLPMSFLHQLERKFGRFTFPYLLPVLLASQVLVYLFQISGQVTILDLYLDGRFILQGQELYRLVTFMVAPMTSSPLWFLIGLSVTWLIGNALQNEWGEFRFSFFLFVGWAGTVLVSLLAPGILVTNIYIYSSLTLAFAKLYPNFQFLLFFIIPVKVKYLAYLTWAFYLLLILVDPSERLLILAGAVLPYGLFFGKDLLMNIQGRRRSSAFRKQAHVSQSKPFHVCSKCGITDLENPDLEFRYLPGDVCICETCLKEDSAE